MTDETLKKLINQIHFHDGDLVDFDNNQKEVILELLQYVRNQAVIEQENDMTIQEITLKSYQ